MQEANLFKARHMAASGRIVAIFLVAAATNAAAQTTISLNADYSEGKYGEPERSTTWTTTFTLKHQRGPLMLKASLPYVRATGTAAAGGDRFALTRQTQTGWGDLTTTGIYDFIDHGEDGLLVGLGVKAKWATANHDNELLTTGRNDYSLLVDAFVPVGDANVFATVGKTRKGDAAGVDYRDPWFSTLGAAYKVSDAWTLGLMHDYRRKLTPHGSPISEATAYVEHKLDRHYKWQFYVVRGFANASPDLAAGITLSYRY